MRKINRFRIPLTLMTGLAVMACVLSSGCGNIGNGAPGASTDEMKADFDKKPIEERAKILMSLPGPLSDKQDKIKAMYAKEGKTAPPEILNGSAGAGAPGGASTAK